MNRIQTGRNRLLECRRANLRGFDINTRLCQRLKRIGAPWRPGSRFYSSLALSIARITACALFIDSWCSNSGTESATIPAPACT